jgi:6-pyruvoyltetrahydropterin/6-carboxytetrahydropterin synthase
VDPDALAARRTRVLLPAIGLVQLPASLTRTVRFFALHRFARRDWSDAENTAAFGALAERPGHGHDYECRVTVSGGLDASLAIVDLTALDRILAEEVTDPLSGRVLNDVVSDFAAPSALPTCEGLARYLYRRIAARLPAGVSLERVRVSEDPTLHAEYREP